MSKEPHPEGQWKGRVACVTRFREDHSVLRLSRRTRAFKRAALTLEQLLFVALAIIGERPSAQRSQVVILRALLKVHMKTNGVTAFLAALDRMDGGLMVSIALTITGHGSIREFFLAIR